MLVSAQRYDDWTGQIPTMSFDGPVSESAQMGTEHSDRPSRLPRPGLPLEIAATVIGIALGSSISNCGGVPSGYAETRSIESGAAWSW